MPKPAKKVTRTEIKPCPFCGSKSVVFSAHFRRVRCNACFCGSDSYPECRHNDPSARDEVIANWNRRTP